MLSEGANRFSLTEVQLETIQDKLAEYVSLEQLKAYIASQLAKHAALPNGLLEAFKQVKTGSHYRIYICRINKNDKLGLARLA